MKSIEAGKGGDGMTIEVGDWVQYRRTWTRLKDVTLGEIVKVHHYPKTGQTMYETELGFLVNEHHIVEVRKAVRA